MIAWLRRPAFAYAAVVLVMAFGLWRVETTANQAQAAARDAKQALAEVEADRAAAARAACETSRKSRAENEQLLVRIVVGLGGRQRIVDIINDAYDHLPPPAPCT